MSLSNLVDIRPDFDGRYKKKVPVVRQAMMRFDLCLFGVPRLTDQTRSARVASIEKQNGQTPPEIFPVDRLRPD